MSKILTLLTAVLISTSVFAEDTSKEVKKTVVCDKAEKMLPYFAKEYQEELFWVGVSGGEGDSTAYTAVLVNKETETWTVVMFNNEIACLLESGKKFKFTIPGLGDRI